MIFDNCYKADSGAISICELIAPLPKSRPRPQTFCESLQEMSDRCSVSQLLGLHMEQGHHAVYNFVPFWSIHVAVSSPFPMSRLDKVFQGFARPRCLELPVCDIVAFLQTGLANNSILLPCLEFSMQLIVASVQTKPDINTIQVYKIHIGLPI